MSYLKYVLPVLLFATCSAGCNKWLDVKPKTEMRRDELFSSQTGFQDALSGAYIKMIDRDLYGYELTIGAVEHLMSSWDVGSALYEQALNRFQYQNAQVESKFSTIFSKQYNVIASVNAILDQIEARKSVFNTPGMYEMIKGECLAVRAYVHFDLLRLYGPVPSLPSASPVLPYVKALSTEFNPRLSMEAFKLALMADLEEAEALLKGVDPILQYSLSALQNPGSILNDFRPDDPYQTFRQFRMNYYAVKALQARAWCWFGDKQKAFENAKLVADAKNTDGTTKFMLGTDADFTTQDMVLSREHIWSLYDFQLYKTFTDFFNNGKLYKGTSANRVLADLYENSDKDIRATKLWSVISILPSGKFNVIKKYQNVEKPSDVFSDYKRWPMLRVSEMYLIMAECGPAAEAQTAWNAYRMARGIGAATLPADAGSVTSLVNKEMWKEFFAEGQSFYAFKRINAPQIRWAPTGFPINYVVPVPRNEFTR